MTDFDLAAIETAITTAADPAAFVAEAGEALGALYQDAQDSGDDTNANRALAAWERVQHLAEMARASDAAARGALEAAKKFAADRDAVAEELAGLIEAMDDLDVDNPHVADLVQTVEENFVEYDQFWRVDTLAYELNYMLSIPLDAAYRIAASSVDISVIDLSALDEFITILTQYRSHWPAEQPS